MFNHDVFARKEMMEEKGKVTSLRFLSWLVLGRREREEKVEEEDVLFEICFLLSCQKRPKDKGKMSKQNKKN